jgi:hypothetical protein
MGHADGRTTAPGVIGMLLDQAHFLTKQVEWSVAGSPVHRDVRTGA